MISGTTTAVDESVGAGLTRRWAVQAIAYEGRTKYQDVLIGTTAQGQTLFCDDERQSSAQTQLCYHEALVIPGVVMAQQHRRALVIGSSEGVASQLLVSQGFDMVEHVDIDEETVRLCAEHLPYGYSTSELSSLVAGAGPITLVFEDGVEYVRRAAEASAEYDLIIVDLPDESEGEDAQQDRLYKSDFLRTCASLLSPGGAVVYQAGCPTVWRQGTLARAVRRFEDVFDSVLPYVSDEHEWVFLVGSSADLDAEGVVERALSGLEALPHAPATIDAQAIRRGAVLPYSIRNGRGDVR